MTTPTPDWLTTGYKHIWHPYTQMQTAPLPLPVENAEGVYFHLTDGRTLLDGIASWWTMCHGYNHPHINSAITEQLQKLPHVMFAGIAHEPAYRLATRLSEITPAGLSRVFFSDSGSVAVEIAMKMAVQFWRNQGDKNRTKFISFRNGYHGDTLGAMSLSDPDDSLHQTFSYYTPKQYVWDIPSDEYSFNEFDSLLADIKKTTAGLIIEPLVQCAGGMKFHAPDVLAEIHRLCKKHEILFIADEIATGFGRTGSLFACEEAGISPDILCIGKALTGGMLPLAATLTHEHIFEGFLSDGIDKAFMHGPTFMANPLACSAALASLDIFSESGYLKKVDVIETGLREGLAPCKKITGVKEVRVHGAVGVVEFEQLSFEEVLRLRKDAITHGIFLRPFGNVLYTTPSFIITQEEIEKLTSTIVTLAKAIRT